MPRRRRAPVPRHERRLLSAASRRGSLRDDPAQGIVVSEYVTDAYGLETISLPDGYTPLEVIVAVKCLSESGHVALVHRFSRNLTTFEAVGMAVSLSDSLRQHLQRDFESCDHPDDDPGADEAGS